VRHLNFQAFHIVIIVCTEINRRTLPLLDNWHKFPYFRANTGFYIPFSEVEVLQISSFFFFFFFFLREVATLYVRSIVLLLINQLYVLPLYRRMSYFLVSFLLDDML
jgi:hypothetical protein